MKTQHATSTQDSATEPTIWTCGRCEVRATRMPGFATGRPPGWSVEEDVVSCLLCRRAAAGDRGVEASGLTGEKMVRIRVASVIEFELDRDAERSNSEIASVCHASVPTVVKVRDRLGLGPGPAPKRRSRS